MKKIFAKNHRHEEVKMTSLSLVHTGASGKPHTALKPHATFDAVHTGTCNKVAPHGFAASTCVDKALHDVLVLIQSIEVAQR